MILAALGSESPRPGNMVSKVQRIQRKTWVEKKRKERRKRNEEEEKRKEAIREKVKKSRGAAERRRKAGERSGGMAAWVLEEAFCSGQGVGWGCQGSRAWIHAQLGGP